MSTNLEIEAKATLSKEDYDKLISNFDASKIYRQINCYYDTKDRQIVKKKCGLRTRVINDKTELTLKIPEAVGKTEINQQISNKELQNLNKYNIFPYGEVKQFLESKLDLDLDCIKLLGFLITDRLDITYKNTLISIDKSEYNSIIDYEIECEAPSMDIAENSLKEFLTKYQIEYKKSAISKLKRFLDSLN